VIIPTLFQSLLLTFQCNSHSETDICDQHMENFISPTSHTQSTMKQICMCNSEW
jgi:hypothetical protein